MDLYRFLHAINILYNRLYVLEFFIKEGYKPLRDAIINSLYYVNYGDELLVEKIVIQSPAEINFRGAGGIIKQIRELIKDLRYRNVYEERMMQTELINKQISVLKKAGYTDEETRELIKHYFPSLKTLSKQIDQNDIYLIEEKTNDETKE